MNHCFPVLNLGAQPIQKGKSSVREVVGQASSEPDFDSGVGQDSNPIWKADCASQVTCPYMLWPLLPLTLPLALTMSPQHGCPLAPKATQGLQPLDTSLVMGHNQNRRQLKVLIALSFPSHLCKCWNLVRIAQQAVCVCNVMHSSFNTECLHFCNSQGTLCWYWVSAQHFMEWRLHSLGMKAPGTSTWLSSCLGSLSQFLYYPVRFALYVYFCFFCCFNLQNLQLDMPNIAVLGKMAKLYLSHKELFFVWWDKTNHMLLVSPKKCCLLKL